MIQGRTSDHKGWPGGHGQAVLTMATQYAVGRRSILNPIEHVDGVIGESGLRARPVTAEEMAWLMHRSRSFDLPTLRNVCAATGVNGQPPKSASSITPRPNFTQPNRKELTNSVEVCVRLVAGEPTARANA